MNTTSPSTSRAWIELDPEALKQNVEILQAKKIKYIFPCIFKDFPFCFIRFYALFACLLYFLVSI